MDAQFTFNFRLKAKHMLESGNEDTHAGKTISLQQEQQLLNAAITLFILALVAGVLGFGGMAGGLASIAQICFFVFIVLFLLSAVSHALRGRAPV